MSINIQLVKRFWSLFNEGRFDDTLNLFITDAIVWWPNTREVFKGREKFIKLNQSYPGRWSINIEQIIPKDDLVISIVKVISIEGSSSFYATTIFKFRENLICEITEYWGENGDPPNWRTECGLSERY